MTQYNNLLIEDIFLSGFVEREGEISVFKTYVLVVFS